MGILHAKSEEDVAVPVPSMVPATLPLHMAPPNRTPVDRPALQSLILVLTEQSFWTWTWTPTVCFRAETAGVLPAAGPPSERGLLQRQLGPYQKESRQTQDKKIVFQARSAVNIGHPPAREGLCLWGFIDFGFPAKGHLSSFFPCSLPQLQKLFLNHPSNWRTQAKPPVMLQSPETEQKGAGRVWLPRHEPQSASLSPGRRVFS